MGPERDRCWCVGGGGGVVGAVLGAGLMRVSRRQRKGDLLHKGVKLPI